jgi:alpha-L-rhamnosidase
MPVAAPEDLRVGDRTHPLNVEGPPLFSWQVGAADDDLQSAYQIQLRHDGADAIVWDSGKKASSQQAYVPYAGPSLVAGESYNWTVRTWNKADVVSEWASNAAFDTGLADSGAGWGATWIKRTPAAGADASDEYTQLRTEANVAAGAVRRARAYVSANQQFELHINGTVVDRGPAFAYPGEGYYQASDVTALVQPGQPLAIGVIQHWYGAGQGRPAGNSGVLVRVVVDHADGTRDVIVSDGKWRVARATQWQMGAPKRSADSGDFVEWLDLRQSREGWDKPGFDASTWAAATVIGAHPTSQFPSLRGQEPRLRSTELTPVSVKTLSDGAAIADFGTVVPARPVVRFAAGSAGRVVPVLAGYRLTGDGHVSADKAMSQGTDMSYRVTQRAGAQEFRAFTYLGFRYLQIGSPGEALAAQAISAILEHSDVPVGRAATFESSDATLNAVFALVQRSALYGAQQQFVDTPTREKGQFLQDASNISIATMMAWRERDTTQKGIDEFIASQKRWWPDGRINAVYPNGDAGRDIPDFTEMFPHWVARYYLETGDQSLLARAYPVLQKIADYVWAYRDAGTGLITNLKGGSGDYTLGIVDWPLGMRYGYDMTVSARTSINILAVEALRSTATAATALGKPASEASQYAARADTLLAAINAKLRRADGMYIDGTTGAAPSTHASELANAYAIAFDVVPAASRSAVATYIAGLGMKQGPMTAHWLVKALADSGQYVALLKLLTDKSNPGWANILAQDGSFTWEAWDAHTAGLSESHAWGSTVVIDILQSVLGMHVTSAGAATVSIRPPGGILSFARGTVYTERGPVHVDWSRSGADGLTLALELPSNVRADVALVAPSPAAVQATGAGAPQPSAATSADGLVHFDVGSGKSSFVVSAAP